MKSIDLNQAILEAAKRIKPVLAKYAADGSDDEYDARKMAKEEIRPILEGIPGIMKIFPDSILSAEIDEMIRDIMMLRESDDIPEDRIAKYLTLLIKEKTYTGFISFEGCKGVPIGRKIGCVTIVEVKDTSERFQSYLKHLEDKRKFHGVTTTTCGKFEIKSYRIAGLKEVLLEDLSLPCFFLATMLGHPVDPNNALVCIHSEFFNKLYLIFDPVYPARGAASYIPEYEPDFAAMERISRKEKRNNLDERILRSVSLFGMARMSKVSGVSFVLMISALEGLLLSKNDNDFLGTKLAEKIVFLIYKEKDNRLLHYKQIKSHYGKRSGFVHGSDTKISASDVHYIEWTYRSVLATMLQHSSTYEKMEAKQKDSEKDGIEDLINGFRFG